MTTYLATLRSRKDLRQEYERVGPTEAWGWWVDVCPGETLRVRDATEADIKRCYIRDDSSRDPKDWLCELGMRGSLVSRRAVHTLVAAT
jgi:hypothetical protein